MTSTSLRVRLALALGLPLAPACRASPEVPPPTAPTTTTTTTTTTTPVVTPGACKPDHIHERVCGLIDDSYAGGGGAASAPYAHCTLNGLPLWDLETHHMLDGWKIHGHEPVLADFRFDAPGTAAFKYTGTYYPEDPRCCYERCNPLVALAKPRAHVPEGMHEYELCVPTPVSTRFPAATARQCAAALRISHIWPYEAADPTDDAPFLRATDTECCYSVASPHHCPPNTFETKDGGCEMPNPGGRPLREAGAVIIAATRTRSGWHTPLGSTGEARHRPVPRMSALATATASRSARRLRRERTATRITTRDATTVVEGAREGAWSDAACAYAATAWAREAAYEHASVAAFARLAIDLMVHGAPAELVDAAHVAARDEIRHAQRCYGIASAFGGSVVGPGPLALAASSSAVTLEDLAVDCFRDGCVNETVAALAVAEASRRAASPAIRDTLAAIADDEARHAELSYRILAWALDEGGPSLRARIATELDAVRAELAHPPIAGAAHRDLDEATGLLAPKTAADLRRRVLADGGIPCTAALLARDHLRKA